MRITPELLARHDRPGPRYTSYPTAPQFGTDFGADAYGERLAQADARDEPLALYVHIPFCAERCLYCGCHVVVARRQQVVEDYLEHLEREIALVAAALPRRRDVLQLHWGGGTPTHLSSSQMRRLHQALARAFHLRPEAELAAEIDPRVTSPEQLETLHELGFNRLSFGVQDFTPEVQAAIGRFQTEQQTRELVDHARRIGLDAFNVDLIYGLPRQTLDAFRKSLDQVIALRPGRVAVYSYAHVPWIRPHQRRIDAETLPSAELKLALQAATLQAFEDAGYARIGMDHFARADDELARAREAGTLTRNFMGYTVQAAPDMLAFGISGIGDVAGAFVQNTKKLSSYYKALKQDRFPVERGFALDADDRARRYVIRELMCNFRLRFADLEQRHGLDFTADFAPEIERLAATVDPSFYRLDSNELRLEPPGQLFVRNVCMAFDRYLDRDDEARPLYSRTV